MVRYPTSAAEPAWKPYAVKALHLAMAKDYQAAADQVLSMCQDLTSAVLPSALLAWIDTLLSNTGIEEYGRLTIPMWQDAENGHKTGSADEVPQAVAWAGRLISARASDDEATFNALLQAVPEGAALGVCVMTLLNVVATTLRGEAVTPR